MAWNIMLHIMYTRSPSSPGRTRHDINSRNDVRGRFVCMARSLAGRIHMHVPAASSGRSPWILRDVIQHSNCSRVDVIINVFFQFMPRESARTWAISRFDELGFFAARVRIAAGGGGRWRWGGLESVCGVIDFCRFLCGLCFRNLLITMVKRFFMSYLINIFLRLVVQCIQSCKIF